ncbi:hypothetical protein [Clostridium estertheticum]|uniref:Uncharacterized protein n=1 Tax=Clostridium estertheticum TaxID=238834 RepID=A0AA47EI60_9CLOT|nr:hypothetical protein [Clostridium estertheticum]MBU3156021.1 hypothetical protein [Clostridium estertheticum]WAG60646.1 hypothetical protein LL038_24555 [Clostridium estertheticum]
MIYDAFKIAKNLNISKVTAYAKMKLPEVKPFLITHNGKTCVDEKGLDAIKQSLKYNQTAESEVAATVVASNVVNLLKEDMIEILKNDIEFIKQQLNVKDGQLYDINKLLENTQILFKQEQEKNKIVLSLPQTIKEHDIQLIDTLNQSLERQRTKALAEEVLHRKKGIFQRIFDK